jgi:hypothetical protein
VRRHSALWRDLHPADGPEVRQDGTRADQDRRRRYRRDHLRPLAQRVEVADREVRIIGSKSNLLQTLTAAAGVKPAAPAVRSSVLIWRRTQSRRTSLQPVDTLGKNRVKYDFPPVPPLVKRPKSIAVRGG